MQANSQLDNKNATLNVISMFKKKKLFFLAGNLITDFSGTGSGKCFLFSFLLMKSLNCNSVRKK
jgi:hypothetical protein